ncbi:MAG: helix-hairpin-helix domain-containing protein [Actinomycetota bacterium]
MPEERPPVGLIMVVAALALAVAAGAWYGNRSQTPPPPATGGGVSYTTVAETIVAHVSGAVLHPGLVTVGADARIADAVAAAGGATTDADLGGLNLAAEVRDGDQIVVPTPGETLGSPASSSHGIDLNRASATELEDLPGVGPVLAARIVAFREEKGRFNAVEDLLDVGGIGEAKLAAMRDSIVSP